MVDKRTEWKIDGNLDNLTHEETLGLLKELVRDDPKIMAQVQKRVKKKVKPSMITDLVGIWNITEMEMWDEKDFNSETQANIEIEKNGSGSFEFDLVQCELDGRMSEDKFEFSFEGMAEGDKVSGRGWVKVTRKGVLEGEFFFHQSDSSKFKAERRKGRRPMTWRSTAR